MQNGLYVGVTLLVLLYDAFSQCLVDTLPLVVRVNSGCSSQGVFTLKAIQGHYHDHPYLQEKSDNTSKN